MNARELTYRALMQFDSTGAQISVILEELLVKQILSFREKKFLYNLVNGVLRHRNLLDWKAGMFYNGKYASALNKFKNIIRPAIYELDFLDFIPPHATVNEYVALARKKLPEGKAAVVNGVLRSYLRDGKNMKPEKKFKYTSTQLAVKYSFPEWLIKRWLEFWDDQETEQLCQAFNERPVFDLSLDIRKMDKQEFERQLASRKIQFTPSDYFENSYKITDIQAISRQKYFQNGICRIQDESARLIIELLEIKPTDLILDACAAPGGKFAVLHDRIPGKNQIFGMDRHSERLNILKYNCQKWQIASQRLIQGDIFNLPFKPLFNRIVLDVPCSGFGTIQKNPDIKWRRKINEIFEFQNIQFNMLRSAAGNVTAGGIIVYSTCTIDPSENEEVVEQFLTDFSGEFELIEPQNRLFDIFRSGNYVRTFPHKHNMDGAFAAYLRKHG